MSNSAFIIVVVAVAVFVFWRLWRSGYEFVVRVDGGHPTVVRGKVPGWFLADIQDICARNGLANVTIRGMRRGSRVSLSFSREVPRASRQQLRNLWTLPR